MPEYCETDRIRGPPKFSREFLTLRFIIFFHGCFHEIQIANHRHIKLHPRLPVRNNSEQGRGTA